LNASSASQQISINALNAATSSYVTSAITASSLITASFSGNTLTFTKGDGATFGVVIPDVSGSTGNFATTGSNVFVGNQTISGSLFVSGSEVLTGTLSASALRVENNTHLDGQLRVTNDAQFDAHILIQGASPHLKLRDTSGGGGSAGYDVRVDTGSFEIHDDTHNRNVLSDIFNSASAQHTTSLTSEVIVISGSTSVTLIGNVSASIISASTINGLGDPLAFSASVDSRINAITASGGIPAGTVSSSAQILSYNIFATTGSNVFTGDQTLTDEAGNTVTLSDISGSLVLVSKGVTSGSAGLSNISASANLVNLIFKSANTQSGSLTLSGSNNILLNASAPTAGFRRYVSSANISLAGNVPEITGSLTYSPTISNNYANNIIRFRGPASSSAWTFNNNIVNANFNIGNADATSANQAIAGGTISNNILIASINYNAYTTPLSASATFQANLVVGAATLTSFSSSIQANNNIFNGNSFAVNNSYFGTASTNAAQRLGLQYNVFGGINSSTLTASGSNTTAAYNREVIGNTTNGSGILLGAVLNGDNSNLYSTLVHGSNLTVTGSSAYNTYQTAGSTFIGRNNDRNGTRASSGETIFAVGTGTSTSNRKTGFLIDSGSNTFIEGTLNVSGSTSFNGAVNITGSLTSSLTEGYVWVGGAGNVSTLAATSSFGGGSVPAGTVSSSAQIVAYNKFATTGSNTFTGNQTIQLVDLTTNGTVYFNGSPFDGGVPIDNIARWVITPGGEQFSQDWTSNSSTNTYGARVLYNNSTSSFNSSIQFNAHQSGSTAEFNIINNSGSTNIELNAASIELNGNIKVNTSTSASAGIVSVDGAGTTVNNGLVTTNSIILATTQELNAGNEYPAVVSGKTAGSFTLSHNFSGNLNVAYLIINPI
jgi:hypothetical protein